MKMNIAILSVVVGTLAGVDQSLAETKDAPAATPAATAAPAAASGPKIQFAEPVYNFGKVSSGELVKHDFVFTNIGTATLEIKEVRPGCGCTTAGTWDKEVEPGKTGSIPLQFNSANFGGAVAKSATVTCNDPNQTNIILRIEGTVWKPIDVTPTMAVFNVSSDSQTNETKIVRIVNNLEEPVELSDLQCTNKAFTAELKTVKPGKEFELHITTVPPFNAPSVFAPISLKTSSSKVPTLNLTAYVVVQQAVAVVPNQIMLPPGPFTNAVHQVFTVRNNGTNSLTLSDAAVNVPGAEVHVQETQPGKFFNLTVDFPAGFEFKPDQKVEVTVKTSHPKFPLITVPVFQRHVPATAALRSSIVPTKVAPSSPPVPVTGGKN